MDGCEGVISVQGFRGAAPTCVSLHACLSGGPHRDGTEGRKGGGGAGQTPGYLVAYVGNVAFEASAEDVAALFEGCSVTRVRLHTDRDTGRPKGFAHVHFLDDSSLDRYPWLSLSPSSPLQRLPLSLRSVIPLQRTHNFLQRCLSSLL